VGDAHTVNVTLEEITAAGRSFVGPIKQLPPAYSAKKINGVPAHRLARRHQEVDLKPVEVEVKQFSILEFRDDLVQFECRVSSGTYVRSIAHELGEKLGVGGHLARLRRTAVAEFNIEHCRSLEQIAQAVADDRLEDVCVHLRRILPEIPSVTATEEDVAKIRHGRTVNLPEMSRSRWVKVFAGQSEVVCLASRVAGTLFHPKVVLI
jgi:tRNA pseudouridine55 synthase